MRSGCVSPSMVLVRGVSLGTLPGPGWHRLLHESLRGRGGTRRASPDPIAPPLRIQTLPVNPTLLEEAGLCIRKSVQGKETTLKGEVKVNIAA